MSQNQVAEMCGTSQGIISQIESGTRSSARVENMLDVLFNLGSQ